MVSKHNLPFEWQDANYRGRGKIAATVLKLQIGHGGSSGPTNVTLPYDML